MKHLYFRVAALLLSVATIVACGSRERKADKLISDYFYKTLYDFESYQPVETTVDSMFISPVFDTKCRDAALLGLEAHNLYKKAQDDVDEAVSTMQIWSGGWDSYSRNRFNEAREKADNSLKEASRQLRAYYEQQLAIKDIANGLGNEFAGWYVTHTYRCKSKGGMALLSKDVFLIDPKCKEVIFHFDTEDPEEAELQEFIFDSVICSADSLKSFIERLDDIKKK